MRVGIIGAGPAGISASLVLAKKNVQVTILDEQPSAGGQIYRNLGNLSEQHAQSLGYEYMEGQSLLKQVEKLAKKKLLNLISRASVWSITEDKEVSWSINGQSYCQKFDAIILATGSIERAMPLNGWTNLGVMTVGAAQILMKTARYSPPNCVLVGSGPLFYLVACQMIKMGNPPKALLETQSNLDLLKAIIHLRPNLTSLSYLAKGLLMLTKLKLAGVKRIKSVSDVRIVSNDRAHIVKFRKGKKKRQIEAQTVLLHAGVQPNIQITQALGIEHDWNYKNHCWEPQADKFGRTSIKNIFVAGDGVKILGADIAKTSGECAALALLIDNGIFIDNADLSRRYRLQQKYIQIRKFLDVLYAPKEWYRCPPNDTIICRCEEVTAGEVRKAVEMGCLGPNQLKAFSRCGMGNCQGRYCGTTVVNLICEIVGQTPEETGYFRIRSPIKPVSLAEVANLETIF